MAPARLWRRLAIALAAAALPLLAAFAVLLGCADRGALDGPILRFASTRLGRAITARALRFDLLSRDPAIRIRGLVIANPAWLQNGRGHLAEVDDLIVHVDLAPLLHGSLRANAIEATGLNLHLIRFGPNRNNWSFTDHPRPGPAFAPLASVRHLSIVRSHIDVDDKGRALLLAGPFRHEPAGPNPFRFQAQGTLKGYPVSLIAVGGQLNGTGVGPVWPFRTRLVDAATIVDARGSSRQPFDLGGYDLGMVARGPNLADLGYLFNFNMPNSAPYRLSARARSDGSHFGFSGLRGIVGASDVTGWLRSDHSGPRRRVRALFRSQVLAREDIDALLAPVPPRAEARSRSGRLVKAVATGRWILPDASFGLARLRATDFDFDVQAARTTGYALPFRTVSTHIAAAGGVLSFRDFTGRLYAGRIAGGGVLDARPDVPHLSARGSLTGARLAQIGPNYGQPPQAAMDLAIDLQGSGTSVHDAAGHARGTVRLRVTDAVMPRRAGWILGGDLLRALGNAGAGKAPTLPIACAAATLGGQNGLLQITALGIRTPLGMARGSGVIDMGQERLRVLLQGQPLQKRLFQVAAPIRLEGPVMTPTLTVLPGAKAHALGLKGKLGLALTPLAGLLPIKGKPPATPVTPDAGC